MLLIEITLYTTLMVAESLLRSKKVTFSMKSSWNDTHKSNKMCGSLSRFWSLCAKIFLSSVGVLMKKSRYRNAVSRFYDAHSNAQNVKIVPDEWLLIFHWWSWNSNSKHRKRRSLKVSFTYSTYFWKLKRMSLLRESPFKKLAYHIISLFGFFAGYIFPFDLWGSIKT